FDKRCEASPQKLQGLADAFVIGKGHCQRGTLSMLSASCGNDGKLASSTPASERAALQSLSKTASETHSKPCARIDRFRATRGDFVSLSLPSWNFSPSGSFKVARSSYASFRPSLTTPSLARDAQSARSASGRRSRGTFSV